VRFAAAAGLVCALAVCCALAPGVALADDGVFCGAGGAVELSSSSHVRMVAEEVVFDCTDPKLAHVSCLFVVVNEGPADTLLIGFPDYWPNTQDDRSIGDGASALRDLLIMVDGETIIPEAKPVVSAPAGSWNQAHVWTCTFAPGQTRVLRTEYRHVYSATTSASHVVDYILKTGATWAGPIGLVVLRIKPGELRLKEPGYPPKWDYTDGEYHWRTTNLEPTQDIFVGMGSPRQYADHLIGFWSHTRDSDDARREVREFGFLHSSAPEFLDEVLAALPDSLPRLRRFLEDLSAERKAELRR